MPVYMQKNSFYYRSTKVHEYLSVFSYVVIPQNWILWKKSFSIKTTFSFSLVNGETMWIFLHFWPLEISFQFIQSSTAKGRSMIWRNNGYFACVEGIPLQSTDRVFCVFMGDLLSPIVRWVFETRNS